MIELVYSNRYYPIDCGAGIFLDHCITKNSRFQRVIFFVTKQIKNEFYLVSSYSTWMWFVDAPIYNLFDKQIQSHLKTVIPLTPYI